MEDTTTNAESTELEGAQALPEADAVKADETTETQTNSESGDEATEEQSEATPSDSEEGQDESDEEKWLRSQGIDPENPSKSDIMRAAKMVRDTRKFADRKQSELRKQLKDNIPKPQASGESDGYMTDAEVLAAKIAELQADLQDTKADTTADKFWQNHDYSPDLDKAMGEVLSEYPSLAVDLEAVHTLATARIAPSIAKSARDQGRNQALDAIARKQSAGTPPTSPKDNKKSEEVDPFLAGFRSVD